MEHTNQTLTSASTLAGIPFLALALLLAGMGAQSSGTAADDTNDDAIKISNGVAAALYLIGAILFTVVALVLFRYTSKQRMSPYGSELPQT